MTDMTLANFMDAYPDYEFLESYQGKTRYSNGLGEGSDHESEWFCDQCDALIPGGCNDYCLDCE